MAKRGRKPAIAVAATPSDVDGTVNDDVNDGNDGNADGSVSEVIDADTITDPEAAVRGTEPEQPAEPRRRRGRPPGPSSGAGSAKAKTLPLNITGVEKLLLGIHGGLAMLSGRMEWSLDNTSPVFDGKTESAFMAQSIADVSRHYTNGLLDQKTVDWLNLAQCLALVYGGRIVAIRMTPRAKQQRPATVQETARDHRAAPPPNAHVTRPPVNQPFNGASDKANVGEVAGLGAIEFPDDHPLSPNFKPRLN